MSSGNFEIGEGLSMEGFKEYIKPNLEKYKTQVTDMMSYADRAGEKILVSLIGDATPSALENTVKISLDEAHKILQDKERTNEDKSAWTHQVKTYGGEKFNTIGIYQNNETASKVFQNLAIEYSTKNINNVLTKAKSDINEFGKKFFRF